MSSLVLETASLVIENMIREFYAIQFLYAKVVNVFARRWVDSERIWRFLRTASWVREERRNQRDEYYERRMIKQFGKRHERLAILPYPEARLILLE